MLQCAEAGENVPLVRAVPSVPQRTSSAGLAWHGSGHTVLQLNVLLFLVPLSAINSAGAHNVYMCVTVICLESRVI